MRKPGFTLAGHQRHGAAIKAARAQMSNILLAIDKGYQKASPQAKAIWRVTRAIDHLRCVLDDATFREHKDADFHTLVHCYYGTGDGPGGAPSVRSGPDASLHRR